MNNPPGSDSEQGWLLHGLLAMAFSRLGEGIPVVVGVRAAGPGLAHSWPRVEVEEVSQLADAVRARLGAGPVLMLPPWDEPSSSHSGGIARPSRVALPEVVLLECRPAGSGSLLAVTLPESTLTSERARPVRESLAAYWQPVVVIYAKGVFPEFDRRFCVAMAVFQARQRRTPVLRVFQIPDNADAASVEDDFRQLLAQRCERGRYGYVVRDPLSVGDSLRFERHDPAVLARRADLAGFGGLVPLDELFELQAPGLHLMHNKDLLCAAGDKDAVRVLRGRDIRPDGTIGPPDDQSHWARITPDRQLRT